ncbi:MAG: hypothetical protein DK306_001641 [Chloroflexi bacterium]|nr:MAG: hypothetical protein DK306_001641 [Chloroflexota bacterium]
MYATATLPLTSHFLTRAHGLDAADWQRVGQRAGRIQITRILEAVAHDWSFEDRVRAVGPQRRLFARHLGRIASRLLPAQAQSDEPSGRVFGPDAAAHGSAVIDAAALAAITALEQPGPLSADAARALYAPFEEAIPLHSLLAAAQAGAQDTAQDTAQTGPMPLTPSLNIASGFAPGLPPRTISGGLASYNENRTPAFGAGAAESRLQRRSQAVRYALASAAAAESAAPHPLSDRLPDAWTAAWRSDLVSYRPSRGAAAALATLALGVGLAAFAIFAFRGDAQPSIAPVSGEIASPAVLNPITPAQDGAPVVIPPAVSAPGTSAPAALLPAEPADTQETIAPGAAPVVVGTVPVIAPAAPPPPATQAADTAAGASPLPSVTGSVPDVPSVADAPPAGTSASTPVAAACTDGACWLAIATVAETDGEWAHAATAYAAAAAITNDPAAALDAQLRASLLRAAHPLDTATAVPAADAMLWLSAGLDALDNGTPLSLSPVLLQAALDSLYAQRLDDQLVVGGYQAVNAAPIGLTQGQFSAVGQILVGEAFLPIGRCADPNGRWLAIWFPDGPSGQINSGWVNLDLLDPWLTPFMGSADANLALQNSMPVLSTPVCGIL